MAGLTLATHAGAATIQGTGAGGGVYLFSAGGSAGTCASPTGNPAAQPTDDIVLNAVGYSLLEFVGNQSQEIDTFAAGIPEGDPSVDNTLSEVVQGLTAIDDFGVIGGAGDDAANFDSGRGGSVTGGLRRIPSVREELIVTPDGVTASGLIGPDSVGNA
ncbi:MAG: hypothetical protein ACRERC_00525, partial [Candidatus Binatia bacterium]